MTFKKRPRINRDEPKINRDEPKINRDAPCINRDEPKINRTSINGNNKETQTGKAEKPKKPKSETGGKSESEKISAAAGKGEAVESTKRGNIIDGTTRPKDHPYNRGPGKGKGEAKG
jgi:hypothetical protein